MNFLYEHPNLLETLVKQDLSATLETMRGVREEAARRVAEGRHVTERKSGLGL